MAGTAGRTLAMGSPQSTNPNGPNYVPPQSNTTANKKPSPSMTLPKMFYVPKMMNGLEVQKIPEDILDNSSLEGWLWDICITLIIFGFVYNMYMNSYRSAIGADSKNKTYWQLFSQFIFAFVFLYIWSKGIFFTQYLTAVDSTQNYIWTSLAAFSGVTGIETTVKHMISVMGGGKTGTGFEWYNPFTWVKLTALARTVIEEFIFSGMLFIVYIIYALVYFLVYLFQLLFIGLLYAVFPIALGLWVGEYSESIKPLQSWFKWFIEVSTWGIVIGLLNVVFNTVIENYLANAGLMNSMTGLSFLVALGLVVVMLAMLLAGPFLIHKIFGMTSAHGHVQASSQKVREIGQKAGQAAKAVATGGASVPADMAKEGVKQGVNEANNAIKEQGGNAGGGIAPGASTKLNEAK